MRFQYCSDIHLEFYNDNVNKVRRLFDVNNKRNKEGKGDILLLAGDIGKPSHMTYRTFIDMMSQQYKRVFVTTGNHEYYKMNMPMKDVDDMCRAICDSMPKKNVTFLQNELCEIMDGLYIHGGTMWSYIPRPYHRIVESSIRDYECITSFDAMTNNALHSTAIASLEQSMSYVKEKNAKLIVMSHHMPGFHLIDPKYKSSTSMIQLNYAFAADIKCTEDECIGAWVYGHTHSSGVHGKFHCNPIGYPGENMNWTLGKYFDITV